MPEEKDASEAQRHWSDIPSATGSPLKLFALIVLICNAVFAVAAALSSNEDAFIYTIHMFLAIVASFVLIALWSPKSFYGPKELLELKKLEAELGDERVFPQSQPLVPTLVLIAGVAGYAAYHIYEREVLRADAACSAKLETCQSLKTGSLVNQSRAGLD